MIDKLVEQEKTMKTKIEVLEAEKLSAESEFQAQLKKLQKEFSEISETSIAEN